MVGEDPGAPGKAQVSDQERGRRRGAAAQSLQAHSDFDERRGEGELGLIDAGQVRLVCVSQPVRPQGLEAVELGLERDFDAHSAGSITLPASWRKAESARTQDSSSRVTT